MNLFYCTYVYMYLCHNTCKSTSWKQFSPRLSPRFLPHFDTYSLLTITPTLPYTTSPQSCHKARARAILTTTIRPRRVQSQQEAVSHQIATVAPRAPVNSSKLQFWAVLCLFTLACRLEFAFGSARSTSLGENRSATSTRSIHIPYPFLVFQEPVQGRKQP